MTSTEVTSTEDWGDRNSTAPDPTKNPGLQRAYSILIPTILAVIMLSMGCGITFQDVKSHAKRPIAPIIGLLSQFIVMPAVAFGLAHALRLLPHHAIGMMIIASCPGGTTSNIFTFWSRGDLPLSICMTLLSTVLALGFMPLNLFIYLRSWSTEQASIPFGNMAISIALTWVPVLIGLLIRYKAEKVAGYVVKAGSVAGMLLIVGAGIIQGQLYPEFFTLSWNVWFAAFGMPAVGFGLGFLLATIACLSIRMRRTVAFETGLQNSGLALTIITLSFPDTYGNMLSQYPLLYSAGQMVIGFALMLIHNLVFLIRSKLVGQAKITKDTPDETTEEKTNDELFTLHITKESISDKNDIPPSYPQP